MSDYYKNSTWKDLPQTVMIELSNSCNYLCAMCSNKHMTRKKGFMTLKTFKNTLDACEEAGIKNIKLYTTGESLLHPQFMEFWKIAITYPFETIMISTNGSLLTDEMIRELIRSDKIRIQFSFCGWDKPSYEMRYVNGDFEKTVEKIKQIKRMIDEAGLPKSIFTVNGAVSGNRGNIKKTKDFLSHLGLTEDQMKIHNANNWIEVVSGRKEEEEEDQIKEKESLSKEQADEKTYYCHIANTRIGILYDGKATACGCLDVDGELTIGDINKEGIRKIREGESFKAFVKKLSSGNIDGLMCRRCYSLKWIKPKADSNVNLIQSD